MSQDRLAINERLCVGGKITRFKKVLCSQKRPQEVYFLEQIYQNKLFIK
jgi:hypothetical protein